MEERRDLTTGTDGLSNRQFEEGSLDQLALWRKRGEEGDEQRVRFGFGFGLICTITFDALSELRGESRDRQGVA